jgi:hypothetical protein
MANEKDDDIDFTRMQKPKNDFERLLLAERTIKNLQALIKTYGIKAGKYDAMEAELEHIQKEYAKFRERYKEKTDSNHAVILQRNGYRSVLGILHKKRQYVTPERFVELFDELYLNLSKKKFTEDELKSLNP